MTENSPIAQAELVIPSSPEHLPSVRELIETTAEQVGFPPQEVQRIVTAAFEAVVNAATHGSPLGPENHIRVAARLYSNRLVVEVSDEGLGFDGVVQGQMPDVTASRGRGIALMRALVDQVELANGDRGARVTLTKFRRVEDD